MKNTSYCSQFSTPASTSAVPASAALSASAPPPYLYLIALNREDTSHTFKWNPFVEF